MKWIIPGIFFFLTVFGICAIRTLAHSANTYYVWDGRTLQTLHENVSRAPHYTQWEIWLYKRSETTQTSSRQWGAIDGKSADEVMRKLKRSQDFEHQYERWCQCDWGDDTFLNPEGPVAIIEPAFQKRPGVIEKLDEAREVYDWDSSGLLEKLAPLLGKQSPWDSSHSALKEYIDHIKDARRKRFQTLQLTGEWAGPST